MKIFLFLIVFILSLISIQAQSQNPLPQNSQVDMQTLVHRVDSLEHELSYLKLTYELNELNSDIIMFANEVEIQYITLQLKYYNRNFDYKLGESYQQYYESCQGRKQVINGLIEAKKILVPLEIISSH